MCPTVGSRTTKPLIDRLLGGNLNLTLRSWRHEGLTLDQIVRRLEDDYGVATSRETIRRWLVDADDTEALA